jgi:hypothetical protein
MSSAVGNVNFRSGRGCEIAPAEEGGAKNVDDYVNTNVDVADLTTVSCMKNPDTIFQMKISCRPDRNASIQQKHQ